MRFLVAGLLALILIAQAHGQARQDLGAWLQGQPAATILNPGDILFTYQGGQDKQVGWQTILGAITSGVTISGTPAVGYSPTATSTTSARWSLSSNPSVWSCLSQAQITDVVAGTKTIDLTSTLQTCLTAFGQNVSVFWPSGTYLISGTLTIPNGQNELGATITWNNGTIISAAAAMNAPLFKFANVAGSAIGFSFIGSATAGTPNQHCIYINNSSDVTIRQNFFTQCYSGLYIDGSSFYTNVLENTFYSNYAYQMWVNSVTMAGVDLIHRGNRYLAATNTQIASVRYDGLGSSIDSDNQFSNNNPTTASVWFSTPAPLFGGAQMSNNVFENGSTTTAPAVYIQGTALAPWINLVFVNSFFTGNLGYGLEVAFASHPSIIGGGMSSLNMGGTVPALFFPGSGVVSDMTVSGVGFDQAGATTVPIQSQGSSTLGVSFTNSRWNGTAAMIDFTAASTAVTYFSFCGGNPGSNVTPIKLPAATPFTECYLGKTVQSGDARSGGAFVSNGGSGSIASDGAAISMYYSSGAGHIDCLFSGSAFQPCQIKSSTFQILGGAGGTNFFDYGITTGSVLTLPAATTLSNAAVKITNLPTSGTATGTLCMTSTGQIFVKTTSGACL